MRLSLIIYSFIIILFQIVVSGSVYAQNNTRPLMLEDGNYTEYWEQYFYLSDGSLVTSQFLVANFPWPVGKDHGIMLGTLVTPEGKLYTIKNGRDLGKWGFNNDTFDMFIHTHRLKSTTNGYNLHLENTMGIADLDLQTLQPPLNHTRYSHENGYIDASFYAPSLIGRGNWQLGPEAGFEPSGPVHNVDKISGFGVHVVLTDKIDTLLQNWTRVLGVSSDETKPFLSSMSRPDGSVETIFNLFNRDQIVDSFSDVHLNYIDMTEEKNASYPKKIEISATGKKGKISGTINFTKKLAHFNLTEHLNFFEKSFAKSNPSMINFRYMADYNFIYTTKDGQKTLTGKALSEYTDILPVMKAPIKRRRSRR